MACFHFVQFVHELCKVVHYSCTMYMSYAYVPRFKEILGLNSKKASLLQEKHIQGNRANILEIPSSSLHLRSTNKNLFNL